MQNLEIDSTTPETETTLSEVDQVLDILGGKSEPESQELEEETRDELEAEPEETEKELGEETRDQEAPKTLETLAETLGLELADLYDVTLNLDTGDGSSQPITLGELKDRVSSTESLSVDRLTFEEDKAAAEKELRQHRQDLADVIASLPRSALTPALVEKIQAQRAKSADRERALTKAVIREWSDEKVEARDRELMRDYLADFGHPSDYLETLVDHRSLAMVRDAALRKQRVDQALSQVRQVHETGHKRSSRPGRVNRKGPGGKVTPKSSSRSRDNQVAAVQNILSGK
jgi:hypothetical protein